MTEISKVFLNEMKTDIEDEVIHGSGYEDQIDLLMDDNRDIENDIKEE